jgi:hypothetical protein
MKIHVMLMLMLWDVNTCLKPRGVTSPDTRPCRGECVSGEQQGVIPKHRLGPKRTKETNPSTYPRAVQKNVDNTKQIRSQICNDLHTSNGISFGRETPNWDTRPKTMIRIEGLYLGDR